MYISNQHDLVLLKKNNLPNSKKKYLLLQINSVSQIPQIEAILMKNFVPKLKKMK